MKKYCYRIRYRKCLPSNRAVIDLAIGLSTEEFSIAIFLQVANVGNLAYVSQKEPN